MAELRVEQEEALSASRAGRDMFCFASTSSTFKLTAFASALGDGEGLWPQ